MKFLEIGLKVGAIIVMLQMMAFGLLLAPGGPVWDGPRGDIGLAGRLFGATLACFPLLYIIPNRMIVRTKARAISYLALTALPILYVLSLAVYLCFVEDHDIDLSVSLFFLLFVVALLGQAPISLLIHMSRMTDAESSTQPSSHSPSAQGTTDVEAEE